MHITRGRKPLCNIYYYEITQFDIPDDILTQFHL